MDYYFDSLWDKQDLLKSGVIRADRSEVFNGWNKVPIRELLDLAACNGLTVFGDVSLLTWNTRQVSLESLAALAEEAAMLRRLGHDASILVVDNGSTDGTPEALRAWEESTAVDIRVILNDSNHGSSIARNQIIDFALEVDADYLLFNDGDIEIIPFSSYAMLRYMEDCGSLLGCVGANSYSFTNMRDKSSQYLFNPAQLKIEDTDLVAWTQYGLFRCEMFKDGVRFDENGPFTDPGWGFEDNDLAFQMAVRGYRNQRFYGATYLHRDCQSSIRAMLAIGIDPKFLFQKRKQYMMQKWEREPRICGGPLRHVRVVELRW